MTAHAKATAVSEVLERFARELCGVWPKNEMCMLGTFVCKKN